MLSHLHCKLRPQCMVKIEKALILCVEDMNRKRVYASMHMCVGGGEVRYHLGFQASTGGLRMYAPQIREDYRS